MESSSSAAKWTPSEDKAFENALLQYSNSPNKWQQIASHLPNKTPADVYIHYTKLVHDVHAIDSGAVDPPRYYDEDEERTTSVTRTEGRKRGLPWSEEEHRRFLEGLERYGKGDWRMISRMAVVTRTPTQVASHAQKYFLRLQSSGNRETKRKSIHDITN